MTENIAGLDAGDLTWDEDNIYLNLASLVLDPSSFVLLDINFHPDAVDEGVILRRKDNLYEGGVGLVWSFAPTWSLRPEVLYIRDQSNVVGFNYSSTEAWINVRKAF